MPIPEVEKIWMNGELVPWADAKVHVLSHALHYGSGVFEGIRCYDTEQGPAVFRLTEHLKRLERSAKLYFMTSQYSVADLAQATKDVIKANGLRACYIRPLVWRGYGEIGVNPLKAPIETMIAVWSWGAYLGEDAAAHGIRAKVSSVRALDQMSLNRAAKACGHYLNSILAKVEATQAGYDEAIMFNERGHVSEGSGENIFAVRNGVLMTPPISDGLLEGITRDSVMALARSLGIAVEERSLSRGDLIVADELFFTGTAAEVVPIRSVDASEIGEPGPITKRIQERFHAVAAGKDPEFAHYMEAVED